MQNASEAITNLMASLESYYDAARNAMLVKKAVKKYGKTQSIVALIGQEGLAAAQTFSMEGFWQKTKEFLIKIWEKIKEWWGRFWGMFFSVENKLSNFESSLSGKRLAHVVEFEGPSEKDLDAAKNKVETAVKLIKDALDKPDGATISENLAKLAGYNTSENSGIISDAVAFGTQTYKLTNITAVSTLATKLKNIITSFKKYKKDIDEYTKKALDVISKMKVKNITYEKHEQFKGGEQGYKQVSTVDDANQEQQDIATKTLKNAAKVNNKLVAAVIKAATQIAVRLMAHTRISA